MNFFVHHSYSFFKVKTTMKFITFFYVLMASSQLTVAMQWQSDEKFFRGQVLPPAATPLTILAATQTMTNSNSTLQNRPPHLMDLIDSLKKQGQQQPERPLSPINQANVPPHEALPWYMQSNNRDTQRPPTPQNYSLSLSRSDVLFE